MRCVRLGFGIEVMIFNETGGVKQSGQSSRRIRTVRFVGAIEKCDTLNESEHVLEAS